MRTGIFLVLLYIFEYQTPLVWTLPRSWRWGRLSGEASSSFNPPFLTTSALYMFPLRLSCRAAQHRLEWALSAPVDMHSAAKLATGAPNKQFSP